MRLRIEFSKWIRNLHAASPNAVMPGGMNHSRNDHKAIVFNHFINHAIGESLGIAPTDVLLGCFRQFNSGFISRSVEYREKFLDEFTSLTSDAQLTAPQPNPHRPSTRAIVQFQYPPNQNLTLLKGKTWKLVDDFIETHGQSLTSLTESFNGLGI